MRIEDCGVRNGRDLLRRESPVGPLGLRPVGQYLLPMPGNPLRPAGRRRQLTTSKWCSYDH